MSLRRSPRGCAALMFAAIGVAAGWPRAAAVTQPASATLGWYKGNTHTHTLNSDGDSTPDEVVRWYREHQYRFVVLTDHNFLTNVDALNALHGADDKFLVIKGEEVTQRLEGGRAVHVNGLDTSRRIGAQTGTTAVELMQRDVDAIREASGVPHINHPNFTWALTVDEIAAVQRNRLFEIFNGHPHVNNVGGGGAPGLEEMWDRLLSSGKVMYGLAVDDAHVFKQPGDPSVPGPGRGWVVVRAPALEPRAIVEALDRGDFYSSTGVELEDYRVTDRDMAITIKQERVSRYRVQFIGRNGRVLKEVAASQATYTFAGGEGYVRAKVIESNGKIAWTQPVMR